MIVVLLSLMVGIDNNSFAETDDKLVVLHTNQGNITIEFFPNDAPNHVKNFLELSESGYYDGTLFHRIISEFMIQGGDPNTKNEPETTWGKGGPEEFLDAEFNNIKHKRGILSMARSTHVDSAGSQFFIVHKDKPNQPNLEDWTNLDGLYTVFGRIVTQESYETLDKIAAVETKSQNIPVNPEQVKIIKAEVVNRSEVADLMELNDPERTIHVIEALEYVDYKNEESGIIFSHPISWFVQEQQNPNEPVVFISGQKLGLMAPVINVFVEEKDMSFGLKLNEIDTFLQEGINSNKIEIISKERTTINGKDSYIIDRIQELRGQNLIFDGRIKLIIFQISDKYYTLTYYNDKNYFNEQQEVFEKFVNSFAITSEKSNDIQNEEGGGCLIATATFGSEMAPQVQKLRELRDNTILATELGTTFMSGFNQLYYSFSPAVADLERESPIFKEVVKLTITPMLSTLSILNYADINSEEEMISYGIGIILMNVGMYFAAPVIIIYKIRKLN